MGFLKNLRQKLTGGGDGGNNEPRGRTPGRGGGTKGSGGDPGLYFYVRLAQTGEVVQLRLIPRQELVPDYQRGGYFSHKVITGPKTLARADALFRFDEGQRFLDAEISGGELTDESEYGDESPATGE